MEGRLKKSGRIRGPRGDPTHEGGGVLLICILASLKLRMDATSSFTVLRRSCGLFGDIGGESDGGEIGGDVAESKKPGP